LKNPVGAASIAQVHVGVWRPTGEKVAVKIQYPNAERLMTGDLKNLRALAEFLQRTEFKFDMLSSIKELQKQIVNEFNFPLEAKNMDFMRNALAQRVPRVSIPRSLMSTDKLLVMTFVEGNNLCRLAEFKKESKAMPLFVKQRIGRRILDTLAKVWGEMIFELRFFNADPHPGNICLGKRIGVLDWGQMKRVSDDAAVKFSRMILAICTNDRDKICDAFYELGVRMTDPGDKQGTEFMALSMMDTRKIPGFSMDPFGPDSPLNGNTIREMPQDLYFLVRSVQLMRGISFAFGLDYSLAEKWAPFARRIMSKYEGGSLR
jgi:aarF domain-containing kinase